MSIILLCGVEMYKILGNTVLKTGQQMEVGVISAPDASHADEIMKFLGHKPGIFKWHIDRCVTESMDALETRFYVGKVEGTIITNIMTVEHEGIGILGHVFTLPDERRKGACKGAMAFQMEDFRQRKGRALYLGTGYNGHPYHVYKGFGFESVIPESGFMKYYVNSDFEETYFSPSPVKTKSVEWCDWSKITALLSITGGDILRSLKWRSYGPTNFEGGFLGFKQDLEEKDDYHDAKLLITSDGAIVGLGTISRDTRWRPETAVLDIFFHPNFAGDAAILLSSLAFPDSKVQCYVDHTSEKKVSVLEDAGFTCEGQLRNQFTYADRNYDVLIYAREA